ncbi:head decoration [Clavibacter phage CN1A]|uniref:Tail fiber protein n=1 Tax=Clavibacter phage CN1A TaxID=1406793 RepID=U5PTS9_9CAUD|nr:head decoration [Clavibacter phage CN1A]AGY47161.1 tail fiber protein [Clavibacter phage CN1A]
MTTLTLPAYKETGWHTKLNAALAALNDGKVEVSAFTTYQDQVSTSLGARALKSDTETALNARVLTSTYGAFLTTNAANLDGKVGTGAFDAYKAQVSASLAGKSDTGHVHAAGDITTGVFAPERLGEPRATAAELSAARVALGIDEVQPLRTMDRPPAVKLTKTNVTSTSIANPYSVAANGNAVLFTGNGPSSADGFYYRNGVGSGTQATFEWWSDAPVLDMCLIGGNTRANLFIDGRLVNLDDIVTDTSGAPYLYNLDFTGHATPSKARHYRLTGINLLFGGIRIGSAHSAWKPAPHKPFVWALGDSYAFGTGASPFAQSALAVAAQDLNWDLLVDGVGGSGWTGGTSGTPLERINAKATTLTRVPDVVLFDLGYNNKSATDHAPIAASIDASVARIRGLFPQARIALKGPATPMGITSQLAAIRETIRARAVALGVAFIETEGWVTSDNRSLYTGADNEHPNSLGHVYLGHRNSAALGAVFPESPFGEVSKAYVDAANSALNAAVATKVSVIVVPQGTTTIPAGTAAGSLILEQGA